MRACGSNWDGRSQRVDLESGSYAGSTEIELHLVGVAPAPGLSRLNRAHDRMVHRVEVPGRVLVLRRVAAADVAAFHAHAQMDPAVACLEALFTPGRSGLHVSNLIKMFTGLHISSVCRLSCEQVRFLNRRRLNQPLKDFVINPPRLLPRSAPSAHVQFRMYR